MEILDPIIQEYINILKNYGRENEIDNLLFNSQIINIIEVKVRQGIKFQELLNEILPIIEQYIDKEIASIVVERVLGFKYSNAVTLVSNHIIQWYLKFLESLGRIRIRFIQF